MWLIWGKLSGKIYFMTNNRLQCRTKSVLFMLKNLSRRKETGKFWIKVFVTKKKIGCEKHITSKSFCDLFTNKFEIYSSSLRQNWDNLKLQAFWFTKSKWVLLKLYGASDAIWYRKMLPRATSSEFIFHLFLYRLCYSSFPLFLSVFHRNFQDFRHSSATFETNIKTLSDHRFLSKLSFAPESRWSDLFFSFCEAFVQACEADNF